MEGIASYIQKLQQKLTTARLEGKKGPSDWQLLAIDILKEIPDAQSKRSSVFGICKKDSHRAKIAFLDCKELNKRHINYLFKVFYALNHYDRDNR
jgi:hypothetical protein